MSWEFLFDRVVPWLLVAQLALILWNRRVLRRPRRHTWNGDAPLISVLVPARDEQDTIGTCIASLLSQDYPNLEIVVLDDGSTDGTRDVIGGFDDPRLRVMSGSPLPADWTGKNWACAQLAEVAQGDVLCFVDADTVLAPETISAALGEMETAGAGLISLLPRTAPGSFAGKVMLPMVTHAAFALFPAAAINSDRAREIAAAFGPFILVTRTAYEAAGGHAAYPDHLVDDMRLARSVKLAGRSIVLLNGTDLVETRWYRGVSEIWNGFAKNAYTALDRNPLVASAVVFVLSPLLLSPAVRLVLGLLDGQVASLVLWQMMLLTANRVLTANLGRDAVWTAPLHALTIAFWAATLFWSMMLTVTGRDVVWKGRALSTGSTDVEE